MSNFFKHELGKAKNINRLRDWLPTDVDNFTIKDGKSYMRRQRKTIKKLWKHNLKIFQLHGFIALLEKGVQLEKRSEFFADILENKSVDSEIKKKIKAHSFTLSLDWNVLQKMIDLYKENRTIEPLTNEILSDIVKQVNKGGRPPKYDHKGITYPMWKAAFEKPNYGENGQKKALIQDILKEFDKRNKHLDKRLIQVQIEKYENGETPPE